MISVIVPTHNRRILLQAAIESVLNQKNVDIEIIVVNDASTDNTETYIKELNHPSIKYLENKASLFAHGSRRLGYKYISGDYVIFMDDDDFYIDEFFFEKVCKIFEVNAGVSAVIGSTIQFISGEYGETVDLGANGLIDGAIYLNDFGGEFKKPLSTLTAVFRRTALDDLSISSFRMVNDTCIFLMGILQGDVFLINEPVAAYRMHEGNISNNRFKISFIKDCYEGKRELYQIAKSMNVLQEPEKWFGRQICQSAFYFIASSGKNFKVCLFTGLWILFRSLGSQASIIRQIIKKL